MYVSCASAVPCVPRQVEARVVCESGAMAVAWEPSKGASSYTAVAQGNGGYTSTRNSSDGTTTWCVFDDLRCGLNYSVTVSASDETCSSAGSAAVELNTGRITCEAHRTPCWSCMFTHVCSYLSVCSAVHTAERNSGDGVR